MKIMHNNGVISLLFRSHTEPLFKKLRRTIIILIIYSTIVVLTEVFYEDFFTKIQLTNLGQFHLIFSFVISVLIAFRVNNSYARWWEARGLWGQLVNNSRNLAFKFHSFINLNQDKEFQSYIRELPKLLAAHLHQDLAKSKDILTNLHIPFTEINRHPNLVISKIYQIINNYRNTNRISLEQFLALDHHIASIVDVVGGCEKIANTPVPSTFKAFVKHALFFYMIIFPFGWVDKFGLLIIPMIIVIVYVLSGLEALSEDLEEPFNKYKRGSQTNDLQLDKIANNIEANIINIANS